MEIVKRAKIKQGVTGSDPMWVANLAAKLIPFDSQGAMWARRYDGTQSAESLGRYEPSVGDGLTVMRPGWRIEGPLYVVYSYATPIAWITSSGSHHAPDVKYSPTTSGHQTMCARMGAGTVWSDQDKTHILWSTQAVRDALRGEWV